MSTPFIRPFNSATDHSPCLHVFFTTIDHSVSHDPARTIGSHLWFKAYAHLSPSTCFVLDDGSGLPVGYIIGTPDTPSFSQRWREEFIPAIDPKLVPPPDVVAEDPAMETELVRGLRRDVYRGECSMLQGEGEEGLLAEYPAHFHIDILPGFTGRGWGRKMMGVFLSAVEGLGARTFYERLGFEVCGEVLDGGVSGEVGTNGGALCLVKRLG